MITQNAIVTKIDNQQVWIENQQKTACNSCLQKESCTSSILEKWLPKRKIAVHSHIPLKPGDEVVVAINDNQLLQATLLIYLVPLFFMFLGAGVSSWLIPTQEAWIIFSSIGSLLFSFCVISKLQNRLIMHMTASPKVIKKVTTN